MSREYGEQTPREIEGKLLLIITLTDMGSECILMEDILKSTKCCHEVKFIKKKKNLD